MKLRLSRRRAALSALALSAAPSIATAQSPALHIAIQTDTSSATRRGLRYPPSAEESTFAHLVQRDG